MYLIDKNNNQIMPIDRKSFSELGFKERQNLQEWLAKYPSALGEELLIIQKEFSGFTETSERLDLLALDKQGNLVLIENKLDDTGKDVVWQALKYASYCSSLKKEQIKDVYQTYLNKNNKDETAEENLSEFFENIEYEEIQLNQGQAQRIILVAANFRKEVTSTVLWLLNYKLRIQCFQVQPFQHNEQLFLDIEQIIPMKNAEDYIISVADKTQEDINTREQLKERHFIRLDFWKTLLKQFNSKTDIFQTISPSKDSWIGLGAGISGIAFNFVVSHTYARTELWIMRSNADENKFVFDSLHKQKAELDTKFGNGLIWERLDDKKASRIKNELNDVNVYNKDDWQKMIDFMTSSMVKLEKTFKEPIMKIRIKLKDKTTEY
jgi:hypothetical protein